MANQQKLNPEQLNQLMNLLKQQQTQPQIDSSFGTSVMSSVNYATKTTATLGKFYGIVSYSITVLICIGVIYFCYIGIQNNNKYIETEGIVVYVYDCSSTPTYDNKGVRTGTSYNCPTIVKFLINNPTNSPASSLKYTLQMLDTNTVDTNTQSPSLPPNITLGFNKDGYCYQKFDFSSKYEIGSKMTIYYQLSDPFKTASTFIIPQLFYKIAIGISVLVIITSILWMYALFNYEAAGAIQGAAFIKNTLF